MDAIIDFISAIAILVFIPLLVVGSIGMVYALYATGKRIKNEDYRLYYNYFVTLLIAVVGLYFGTTPSPIEPPWIFFFSMPGLFAGIVAFLWTVLLIWAFSLGAADKLPYPYKPLGLLFVIAAWFFAIPTFYSYNFYGSFNIINHFSFDVMSFIYYIEHRGLFVAQLIAIAYVLYLVGRNKPKWGMNVLCEKYPYSSPTCYCIPYTFIPIISMFISAILSPEHDMLAMTTGLDVFLVYYLWVSIAMMIGQLVGQIHSGLR